MQKRFFVWSLFVHGAFFLFLIMGSAQNGQPGLNHAYSLPREEKVVVRDFVVPPDNVEAVPPSDRNDYSPGITSGSDHHVSQGKSLQMKKLHNSADSTKKIRRVLPKKTEELVPLPPKKFHSKTAEKMKVTKKRVDKISSDRIMASVLAEKNKIHKEIGNKYLQTQLDKSVALLEFSRERKEYLESIRNKIYAGVLSSTAFSPKLETIVKVYQDRRGKIISVSVIKSSGNRNYDEQVVSAAYRGSPLPFPVRTDLFRDTIVLKFSPQRKV
ncbi:energy transducer TonB [Candidatus Ichthyocystis hellenicum]|uniref:energy transducer TonB n=1 Tax=Candidatus Ichthyocystis hellenicum TaxID=1561003 RepID=UPI000B864A55|nr:energy transducer TonB [Candidatus Ichthyocystis hellenicum]